MGRRLLTGLLAFVIVGAPLATEICEAACAARDAAATSASAAMPMHHHSCHQEAAPVSGTSVSEVHICGHEDGLPAGLERAAHSMPPPAIIPVAIVVAPPVSTIGSLPTRIESSPPTTLSLLSQLRV